MPLTYEWDLGKSRFERIIERIIQCRHNYPYFQTIRNIYSRMAIAFLIFGHKLQTNNPLFWFMMMVGMLSGFITDTELNAGSTIMIPAQNDDYGYQQGEIKDPFGHQWLIETKI